MNYYFYIEDSNSGKFFFNYLIKYILTNHTKVRTIKDLVKNNYVVESGFGYPSMLGTNTSSKNKNRLGLVIDTINKYGNVDYLITCLDTEAEGNIRINEIKNQIENYKNKLNCKYKIFEQNICLETWLLGIDILYPKKIPTSSKLRKFTNHFDAKKRDPEEMRSFNNFDNSESAFHYIYFKQLCHLNNQIYTKATSHFLKDEIYLESLLKRVNNTHHLNSLNQFISFFKQY